MREKREREIFIRNFSERVGLGRAPRYEERGVKKTRGREIVLGSEKEPERGKNGRGTCVCARKREREREKGDGWGERGLSQRQTN